MTHASQMIGLIAGNGKLPLLVAEQAKREAYALHVCAIHGETDAAISEMADSIEWVRLGQLKRLIDYFKKRGVRQAIMAGKITKTNIFKGDVRPDFDMLQLMTFIKDRKDDTLLGAVASHLKKNGIELLSSVSLLSSLLPKAGVLSKRKPTKEDESEIEFGWKVAKEIAGMDIGQTVVIKNKSVLAVEAIEGTDQAILRGGELVSGDVAVIKVAKPKQDMRFDVPTVGLQTLEIMIRAKVRLLAFEAGKTILMDRDQFLKKADQHRMVVVAK